MMKDKRRPEGPPFVFEVSIQHSILTYRHFPYDSGCRCPFYDPASEYFRILGFQSECQCRNHFETVPLDDVSISATGAADNVFFIQNAAFENRSDIRAYGSSEYSEQIGNLSLCKPYTVGHRVNHYLPIRNHYGLSRHIHLILYRFFVEFELSACGQFPQLLRILVYLLVCYMGIDLGGHQPSVSHHAADRFNRHAQRKRDMRSEIMP